MAKPFPQLTKRGSAALKVSEGEINYVYDDAVFPTKPWKRGTAIRGSLTAGVGHLLSRYNKKTKKHDIFPEAEQWIEKTIPQDVIDRWFDADNDSAERTVHQGVKVKLEPNQRDALISFTFNVGNGAFLGSTLLRKLNAGDKASVPKELQKWTKTTINGKKITSKGLQKRRADEIAMWLSGAVPETRPEAVPHGSQIGEAEKKAISPMEAISTGGAVIGGATGFAYATGPVAWAFFALVMAVIIIGGIIIVKRYVLDNRSVPQAKVE